MRHSAFVATKGVGRRFKFVFVKPCWLCRCVSAKPTIRGEQLFLQTLDASENTLTYDTETDFSIYKRKIPSIRRHINFHVFESADRLAGLSEILAERFPYRVTSKSG